MKWTLLVLQPSLKMSGEYAGDVIFTAHLSGPHTTTLNSKSGYLTPIGGAQCSSENEKKPLFQLLLKRIIMKHFQFGIMVFHII